MKRTSIILLSLALILGACSGDPGPDPAEDPKDALTSAFDKLGDGGYTFTLRLDSDPNSLVALSADEGGDPMEAQDAQKILDSSISFSSTDEEDAQERDAAIAVNVAGNEDAIEIRVIDEALFARADVRELIETFGGDTADLDQVAQQSPPGFEFIGPALEGEWLTVPNAEQLTDQLTGGMAPTPNEADQQQLVDDIGAALERSSQVTSEGDDDAGHHLVATVAVRDFYEDFRTSIQSLVGQLPGTDLPPASEIPDEQIRFDVWVDGGEVTQLHIDFLQLASFGDEEVPAGVERLGLLIEVEGFGDSVDAPDDAVEVNTETLLQGLMQAGAGASMQEGSAEFDGSVEELCDQLAGAPPEVLEQFAEQCPELQ